MAYRILLVCTGNTCRSPMAGAILRDLLAERARDGSSRFVVDTAGTRAEPDQPAHEDAVAVMQEQGLDLSGHRTQPLTQDMVAQADLILTMTKAHKEQVLRMHPRAAEKTFTLKEFAHDDREGDIEDPVGRGRDVYRRTAQELRRALAAVVDKLHSDPFPG
ncbi:MAG: low molecular weight protein arginine phosphatase [Limnochordales bacterium]|nr:low molecular weight protein arginine phosphatase [Limnochordales bacterium]